jgi:hypothetical protein
MAHGSIVSVILIAMVGLAHGQTSNILRFRHGSPNVEHFLVQPKISLTVAYAADGQACEMLIEPPHPLRRNEADEVSFMPTDAVSHLLDELVPMFERGEPMLSVTTSGCNKFAMSDYSEVTIMRSQHNCQPGSPDRDMRVSITFKNRACVGR